MNKKTFEKIKNRVLLAVGILLCCFPVFSNFYAQHEQDSIVQSYRSAVQHLTGTQMKAMFKQAQLYNSTLYAIQGSSIVNVDTSLLQDEKYEKTLSVTDTGLMGNIEIPSIDVNLTIYHGTDDDVLAKGVGHLKESSLPVGGKNTRCILTGHRGLPTAKLFTRLDEVKKGDMFYIHVCNRTLAYKVREVKVILPDDLESLNIVPGKDLVSLVTCTPYGINTKRLVVTGERVPYVPAVKKKIQKKMMSFREVAFLLLPVLLVGYVIYRKIKSKNKIVFKKERRKA